MTSALKEYFDRLARVKSEGKLEAIYPSSLKGGDESMSEGLRLMRVLIADTDSALDDQVKPEDRVVLDSEEFWFDGSDEEVMLAFDVQEAIEGHNVMRSKVVDKEILRNHGTTSYLEPIRLDDLKIVKVEIAIF